MAGQGRTIRADSSSHRLPPRPSSTSATAHVPFDDKLQAALPQRFGEVRVYPDGTNVLVLEDGRRLEMKRAVEIVYGQTRA